MTIELCWYLNSSRKKRRSTCGVWTIPFLFPRQFSNWMNQIVQNRKKKEMWKKRQQHRFLLFIKYKEPKTDDCSIYSAGSIAIHTMNEEIFVYFFSFILFFFVVVQRNLSIQKKRYGNVEFRFIFFFFNQIPCHLQMNRDGKAI